MASISASEEALEPEPPVPGEDEGEGQSGTQAEPSGITVEEADKTPCAIAGENDAEVEEIVLPVVTENGELHNSAAAAEAPAPAVVRRERIGTFKIFLRNLATGTTAEELRVVFEVYGKVLECEVFSRNFAFVHMEDEACGRNAIEMVNSKLINGKCVTVEESNKKEGPSVPSTRLRVLNVPPSLSILQLRSLFAEYGGIMSVEINGTEGIVVIEALADVRSAIKNVNGHRCEGGEVLVVEPLVNTSISYNPTRKIRPDPPQKQTQGLLPQWQPVAPPRNNFRAPRQRGSWGFNGRGRLPSYYPEEERLLRDPYCEPPPEYYQPHPTEYYPPQPPYQNQFQFDSRPPQPLFHADAEIEPLFLQRDALLGQPPRRAFGPPAPSYENYYEDYEQFDDYQQPMYSGSNNNWSHPPQRQRQNAYGRGGFRGRSKRPANISVPEAEPGEAFQVPGMIAPGTFNPPRKYFANLPKRPRKKKKKADRPEPPPIPEEPPARPVPDFSSYYNVVPDNAVLKPFPPPANPDVVDFTEDTPY